MSSRTSFRRIGIAIVSATLLLALVSCTPPGPVFGPTPLPASASATPTPTPSADVSAPAPVIGATCADLVATSTLATAFGSVSPMNPAQAMMDAYPAIAEVYVVRSLGGLACEWNNGQPQNDTTGTNPAYVGLRVQALPNGESQFARYSDYYGPDSAGHYCATASAPLYCSINELVGSAWVEIVSYGASSSGAAAAAEAEILAAIGSAGPGASPWVVPAGTAALPANCPGVVSDAAVITTLGLADPVQAASGGGGWSLGAGALQNWGGPHCYWGFLNSDSGVGSLATLPGGAWAWAQAREFLTLPSAPESVSIPGLAAGDEAWLRCAADNSECLLDLVIGGNWVEAYVWRDSPVTSVDRRAGAFALGAAIVAQIG